MAYKKLNGEHYLRPSWRAMMHRCYSSKDPAYTNYGGHGWSVREALTTKGGV